MWLSSSVRAAFLLVVLCASTPFLYSSAFTGNSPTIYKTITKSPLSNKPPFPRPSFRNKKTRVKISVVSEINSIIHYDYGKFGEAFKSIFTTLFFFGGLIPAAITANKSMFTTITGGKREEVVGNPETSLDPTSTIPKKYIFSSEASGPNLPNSALIFATEEVPLVDIIAIAGRINNVDSVADWKNLPSTRVDDLLLPDKPPMWLPRVTFKANIRARKFTSWPIDPETGLPVGGEELKNMEEPRIKKNNALIGDAALDAFFDTWAQGAGIATPDKVEAQLNSWRVGDTLDIKKFTNAAIRGRATTGFAAFSFIVIQVVGYGYLIVAPALRFLFDIDLGFGL